ncbi:hypothetical protein DYB37_005061 [Aphanomyces astaci]|uniref:Uncharacterized protein n=1 Tax=Aphanomyces astaci TaxID=112090 RepID=A0A3R7EY38_APHAT|nr:hypothetical protein DYB35_003811 [Aphanomyces astaci]RHZ18478.1 hypothetical protein DYB26_004315 [Aphanomyces astaci]RHZ28547.1 hypothetical protein DYB37_005061 [Aphanomyces astaci]RQM28700.1 hypothetical protein B5M09_008036 [Aphanomyces astaci]
MNVCRWHNHLNPSIKKGPWEPHEDEKLVELQAKYGNRWALITKALPGRLKVEPLRAKPSRPVVVAAVAETDDEFAWVSDEWASMDVSAWDDMVIQASDVL